VPFEETPTKMEELRKIKERENGKQKCKIGATLDKCW
jgi:hypothetical protein